MCGVFRVLGACLFALWRKTLELGSGSHHTFRESTHFWGFWWVDIVCCFMDVAVDIPTLRFVISGFKEFITVGSMTFAFFLGVAKSLQRKALLGCAHFHFHAHVFSRPWLMFWLGLEETKEGAGRLRVTFTQDCFSLGV